FAPLGLTHTWAPRPGDPAPQGRVASYWEVAGGQLENVSDYQAAYDVQVPGGGGILGTPVENVIFANAIARGTWLSAEMHEAQLAWSPQSVAWARDRDDGFAYGLGLSRREWTIDGEPTTWVGHTGGGAGTTALMMARPDADYAIAVAANLGGFLGGPLNAFIDEDWVQEVLTAASAAP
ncbi:MAG: serine hydrolase, partial [Myxococcota bacterium]